MAIHISKKADLDAKLKEAGNNLVLIDFYAQWCGPCKIIGPRLDEELVPEFPDLVLIKIDVDEAEEIVEEYEIHSMPTFVFIKNSTKIEQFAGGPYEKVRDTVKKLK
uniref:Thioredoxin n=1 Tax=Clastoptera arizonana TaxID=38151 RepID=A0A1B6EEF8_9HEMI